MSHSAVNWNAIAAALTTALSVLVRPLVSYMRTLGPRMGMTGGEWLRYVRVERRGSNRGAQRLLRKWSRRK